MNTPVLGRHFAAAGATLGFVLMLGMAAEAQVAISINGSTVNVNPEPMIQAGRVFVPLRGVFESLGATVVYDNGQINATGNGHQISVQIGSNQATVDGQPETLDVAPFIVGASTYVPLRFLSQSLGASVSWDNASRVVYISMAGAPQQYNAPAAQPAQPASYDDSSAYEENDDFITQPPPPIPYYEPPPVPAPNYIWMPGYWAWGFGGYYWVPGTWVPAPQPQYVWTPGYWGFSAGYFGWHPGYWSTAIGFYGGVDYGGGYYGHGYAGGRWFGNVFRYNTAVTRVVNTTIIRNVYVDRTVIVDTTTTNRISYNGGPRGLTTRPTPAEVNVTHLRHLPITPLQQQHIKVASQDRGLLATVNAGKPPIVTAPKPFTPATRPAGFTPITTRDRETAQKLVAPISRPAVAPGITRPAVRPVVTARPIAPEMGRPTPEHTMVTRPTYENPPTSRPAVPVTRPMTPAPYEREPYVRPVVTPHPMGEPGMHQPMYRPAATPHPYVPAERPAPAMRPAHVPTPAHTPAHRAAPRPMRTEPPPH
jgi:hypothetical protein